MEIIIEIQQLEETKMKGTVGNYFGVKRKGRISDRDHSVRKAFGVQEEDYIGEED